MVVDSKYAVRFHTKAIYLLIQYIMDIVIMVGTHNFCPNYHYIHISLYPYITTYIHYHYNYYHYIHIIGKVFKIIFKKSLYEMI